MQFLLNHSVDMDGLRGLPQFEEAGEDLINDILTGAAAFSSDVIAPTNWDGDQNPAKLNGDDVTASPGFKEAYKAFVEGGWQTLATPAEIGGMGHKRACLCGASGHLSLQDGNRRVERGDVPDGTAGRIRPRPGSHQSGR